MGLVAAGPSALTSSTALDKDGLFGRVSDTKPLRLQSTCPIIDKPEHGNCPCNTSITVDGLHQRDLINITVFALP